MLNSHLVLRVRRDKAVRDEIRLLLLLWEPREWLVGVPQKVQARDLYSQENHLRLGFDRRVSTREAQETIVLQIQRMFQTTAKWTILVERNVVEDRGQHSYLHINGLFVKEQSLFGRQLHSRLHKNKSLANL